MEYRRGRITQEYRRWGRLATSAAARRVTTPRHRAIVLLPTVHGTCRRAARFPFRQWSLLPVTDRTAPHCNVCGVNLSVVTTRHGPRCWFHIPASPAMVANGAAERLAPCAARRRRALLV